jgi:hypothetical protein
MCSSCGHCLPLTLLIEGIPLPTAHLRFLAKQNNDESIGLFRNLIITAATNKDDEAIITYYCVVVSSIEASMAKRSDYA